ncbi:MAG: hypothetical protein HYZ28_24755 [Myxococcales bacterium]|nr:hypothetical protein [Myxococcales bacterium]
MYCEACGAISETKYVELYQNIGALVMRFGKSIKGQLCRGCIGRYFWEMTLITLFFGWWGIISFILTPIFLINNVWRFASSRSLPAPEPHPMGGTVDERLARLRGE